jgi:hypothetical protein
MLVRLMAKEYDWFLLEGSPTKELSCHDQQFPAPQRQRLTA